LAEARGSIKVPLRYHLDRGWLRFLKGCPANHASLSAAAFGNVVGLGVLMALSASMGGYVG
jgi:hypothetical protein